jgi:hypothetical protein
MRCLPRFRAPAAQPRRRIHPAGRGAPRVPLVVGLGILAALLWGPLPGDAQEVCFDQRRVRVAPALLQDDEGDRALGVRASAGVCRIQHDTRADFSRSAFWEGAVDATVPLSRLRLPQAMEAGVGGGLSVSLARRAPLDLDADPDDPDQGFWDFNYGFLGMGARAGYEADAVWDEHGWVGGAELRWTDPARVLLPSVVVGLQGVRPVGSRLRDGLGVEREAHGRLSLSGYWRLPLPGALELAMDAGHFRNWGLHSALEDVGLDSGSHLAGELGWRLGRPIGPLRLDALFVGYAGGRPPTAIAGRRAWTVGVELGVP